MPFHSHYSSRNDSKNRSIEETDSWIIETNESSHSRHSDGARGWDRIGSNSQQSVDDLMIVGWKEFVSLPELGIERMTAKLDSGANSSSLHAQGLEILTRKKVMWARFLTFCESSTHSDLIECLMPLAGWRKVRSSNGLEENRPLIRTILNLGGYDWEVDLTLADRHAMECGVLIGRDAISSRCLIDCSRAFRLNRNRAQS